MHQFLTLIGIFLNFFVLVILVRERLTQINSNNSPFGNEMKGVMWSNINITHTLPNSRQEFNTSLNCLKSICQEISRYQVTSVTILVHNRISNCNATFYDGLTYLYEHDPIKITIIIVSLIIGSLGFLILSKVLSKYHNVIFALTLTLYISTVLLIVIYGLGIIGLGVPEQQIINDERYNQFYLIYVSGNHLLISACLLIKIVLSVRDIFIKYSNLVQLDSNYL